MPNNQSRLNRDQTEQIKFFEKAILVTVRNREKILFQDKIKAMTSFNEVGPFDVLPEHANFISLIKKTLVLHKESGQKEELQIDDGVLKVYENEVRIYIGVLPHLTEEK